MSYVPWEEFPRLHPKQLPNTLGEDHYHWRQDQVLKSIGDSISKVMAKIKLGCHGRNITFVRAGEQLHSQPKLAAGLITLALTGSCKSIWEGSSSSRSTLWQLH